MGYMDKKAYFLLGLFKAGYKKSYLSCMDFISYKKDNYTRIEMVLPNVGELRLYQRFIELPDGEQIPDIKVYYTSADTEKNLRTLITDKDLSSSAINMIYKYKKYCEEHPESKVSDNSIILKKILQNKQLALKVYKRNILRNRNWFNIGIQK